MLKELLACALVAGSMCAASSADATVVLNVTQQSVQSQIPMTFDIVATNDVTTITIGGYHIPSYMQLTAISLSTSSAGGTNLLTKVWTFTAATTNFKYGTYTDQYVDGYTTGTNALEFGSTVVGAYDGYSQSFASTPDVTYYLNFLFTQDYDPSKNGLQIVTDQALVQDPILPVPEPTSWAMLVAGFGLVGWALRRRDSAGAVFIA